MEAEERELEVISTLRPPSGDGSRRSSSASRRSNSFKQQASPQPLSNMASPQPPKMVNNGDACYVDIPPGGIPVIELDEPPEPDDSPDSRRCSARMISMNLQHTLRQCISSCYIQIHFSKYFNMPRTFYKYYKLLMSSVQ